MRAHRDLLALSVCLISIALLFRLLSPAARQAPFPYQVDGFGLGVEVAELERQLGPQGRVSSGVGGESWISYGNSRELEFLINPALKTFAVRGRSVWKEGRQVLASGAELAEIERELGPASQVTDSERGASRRLRYAAYGLDLVLWISSESTETGAPLRLEKATLRADR